MRTLIIITIMSMNINAKVNDRDFINNGQLEAYDYDGDIVYFERNIKDKNSIFENVSNEKKLFSSIEEQKRVITKILKCSGKVELLLEENDTIHINTLNEINKCK